MFSFIKAPEENIQKQGEKSTSKTVEVFLLVRSEDRLSKNKFHSTLKHPLSKTSSFDQLSLTLSRRANAPSLFFLSFSHQIRLLPSHHQRLYLLLYVIKIHHH